MEVSPRLWRIPLTIPGHTLGGANVYLVGDSDGFALIDTGENLTDCWDQLQAYLGTIKVPLGAIHTIIPTHGHADHAGLAARLVEEAGARAWLHYADAKLLASAVLSGPAELPLLTPWLVRHGFTAEEAAVVTGFVEQAHRLTPPFPCERLLEGGETLSFGEYRFEVVWTPGHTPGHICLYEPSRHLLFTGDHVFAGTSPNVSQRPYSPRSPMPSYLDSLSFVQKLEVETALPGHGELIDSFEARVGQIIDHQLARRERLLSLVSESPRSAIELCAQLWPEGARRSWSRFNGRLRYNALGTVVAHLEALAEQGMVERLEDEVVRFARR